MWFLKLHFPAPCSAPHPYQGRRHLPGWQRPNLSKQCQLQCREPQTLSWGQTHACCCKSWPAGLRVPAPVSDLSHGPIMFFLLKRENICGGVTGDGLCRTLQESSAMLCATPTPQSREAGQGWPPSVSGSGPSRQGRRPKPRGWTPRSGEETSGSWAACAFCRLRSSGAWSGRRGRGEAPGHLLLPRTPR